MQDPAAREAHGGGEEGARMTTAAIANPVDHGDESEAVLRLVDRLASWQLTFPTSAHIALSVVEAINAPNCSLESIARPLQAEPLLSTKVIALANSAAFNTSGRSFTSVREAVQRIGLSTLKTLALSVVMKQMAAGASGERSAAAAVLWEHSAHVAALAYVLARRLTGQSAEAAMFAGIVHELSGFYLLSKPSEQLGISEAALARILGGAGGRDLHDDGHGEPLMARIGRPLLRATQVPEPIIEAVSAIWKGDFKLPPDSLGYTLMLADALAPVRSPFEPAALGGVSPYRAEIDQQVDRDTLAACLEESSEIIASLLGVLRS